MFLFFQTPWQAEKYPKRRQFSLSEMEFSEAFCRTLFLSCWIPWKALEWRNQRRIWPALLGFSVSLVSETFRESTFFHYSLWLPHPSLNFQLIACHPLYQGRGRWRFSSQSCTFPCLQGHGAHHSSAASHILQPDPTPLWTLPWHRCFSPINVILITIILHSSSVPTN